MRYRDAAASAGVPDRLPHCHSLAHGLTLRPLEFSFSSVALPGLHIFLFNRIFFLFFSRLWVVSSTLPVLPGVAVPSSGALNNVYGHCGEYFPSESRNGPAVDGRGGGGGERGVGGGREEAASV